METIILNRMYVGEYLEENIGHEVINLFKADDGSNYIYVNEKGRVNVDDYGDFKAVLLVKRVESGVLEVVAKAEDLELIYEKKKGKDDETRYRAEVEAENEKIEDEQITYGGVLLTDIYKNGKETLKVTFKAKQLRKVREPLFLIEEESKIDKYKKNHYHYCFLPIKHFSKSSLKVYYPNEGNLEQDYEKLCELLQDTEIWEDENTTKRIDLDEIHTYESHEGFLSIIKKENDELVFSNLFSYIFNAKKDVFRDFAKDVLKIKDFKMDYTIVREKKNIDLLIENKDTVIIIENKIKSDINSKKSKSSKEGIESQLSKYFEYVNENEDYRNKKLKFCIFAPDYNKINLDIYKKGEHYDIINYSVIYKFYCKNAGRMLNVKYFKEFLDALYVHTKTTDNTNFENMKRQFLKNIHESQKKDD